MEYIWAPWRLSYIKGIVARMDSDAKKTGRRNCLFCQLASARPSPRSLVLARGRFCYVVLNRYPFTSGHFMVIPLEHRRSLEQMTIDERLEMLDLTVRYQGALDRCFNPQGYNLGINLGRVAGAGIPGHLHVVPRWGGDTNFMPSIGGVRVLPTSLGRLYRMMKQAYQNGERSRRPRR
jgi:ATP adenylyltransferase